VIPVTIILQPMQNQLRFLIRFVGDILRLSELPPFVGFLIGALVVDDSQIYGGGGASLIQRTLYDEKVSNGRGYLLTRVTLFIDSSDFI
jgi:hypothetical protein